MKKWLIPVLRYLFDQAIMLPLYAIVITGVKFAGTWLTGRYWTRVDIEDNKLKVALLESIGNRDNKKFNHYRADRLWDAKSESRYVAMIGLEPYTVTRYGGKMFVIHYRQEQLANTADSGSYISQSETPGEGSMLQSADKISIFALNATKHDIQAYLTHVQSGIDVSSDKTLWIYINSEHGWDHIGELNHRDIDSIILPKHHLDTIIADVEEFRTHESKAWHEQFGIKYKRGYLLYGPPGVGKTSLITAIANHFKLHVYVLRVNKSKMSDQMLQQLIRNVSKDAIIVIEDIDAAFAGREGAGVESGAYSMTFAGILEALDGITSAQGRIVFMTTNHPEKLDPALVRPGRVDFSMEFKSADKEQIVRLLERFYPSMHIEQVKEMATKFLTRENVTIAEIQQFIQKYKHDYASAYIGVFNEWEKDR